MKQSILITDKVDPALIRGLRYLNMQVDYKPDITFEEVCNRINKYDGLIVNSKIRCDREFLQTASHLDFIGRLGSGLDIIDMDFAEKTGIRILSSPEGNANAVGEHTLGMLLSLLNNISVSHAFVKQRIWEREIHRGVELGDKIIGIIGFGHTGPAFAKKLSGFDVEILVNDIYKHNLSKPDQNIRQVELSELLEISDVVSLHIPLTEETRNLVDTSFLDRMKDGSILINTSRGQIAKSDAILSALQSGKLAGACLDVVENERPKSWNKKEEEVYAALFNRDDVIITPHIAGWTKKSLFLIADVLLEKIRNFYDL